MKLLRSKGKLIIISVLIFIITLVILAIGKRISVPISGDEPHYLIMAESIIHDGNLDVKNEYKENLFSYFYNPPIDAHINTSQFNDISQHWYSIHYPGMAMLIFPFFVMAGKIGVMAFMTIFSVVLLCLTYFWNLKITTNKKLSVLAAAILLFSTFYLGMIGRILPDIIIADFLLSALLLMEKTNKRQIDLFLIGILAGLSFWLHFKSVLFLLTILMIVFIQIVYKKETFKVRFYNLLFLLVPFLVLILIFELKLHEWYHFWLPNQIYSGNGQSLSLESTRSLLAILFDSVKGLIVNNPAMILLFAGIPVWFYKKKGQFLRVCIVILPSVMIFSSFSDWYGGWSPSGRYVMETLPVVIPSIVLLLPLIKNIFSRTIIFMIIFLHFSLGIAYIVAKPNWSLYENVIYSKLSRLLGINISSFFPRFSLDGAILNPLDYKLLIFWSTLSAIFFISGLLLIKLRINKSN